MADNQVQVKVFDLVAAIARVVDMMSPAVGGHHMQVAYLAYRLGEALGLKTEQLDELVMAAALHDIGAFSLQERLDLLAFEEARAEEHCLSGSFILSKFKMFEPIARIVRFHHQPWENGKGAARGGESVPVNSHILHLADRVAVSIYKEKPILSQVRAIEEAVMPLSGEIFVPEHVAALRRLAWQDYVWLDVVSGDVETMLRQHVFTRVQGLTLGELLEFAQLVCRLVDFKSKFTATHSSGVAAVAESLARRVGFSSQECRMMEIAAYFHDLGKLAIPSEILENPGRLTDDQWFIMRSHVYFTYKALASFETFSTVSAWGALHQERLNGSGYPFGLTAEQLPLGARIMAVADVFTALTEDRPYRRGMDAQQTVKVLDQMVVDGELDKWLVDTVVSHFDAVNATRDVAQKKAMRDYNAFQVALHAAAGQAA